MLYLWPPRKYFSCRIKWKSLGVRLGLYKVWSKHPFWKSFWKAKHPCSGLFVIFSVCGRALSCIKIMTMVLVLYCAAQLLNCLTIKIFINFFTLQQNINHYNVFSAPKHCSHDFLRRQDLLWFYFCWEQSVSSFHWLPFGFQNVIFNPSFTPFEFVGLTFFAFRKRITDQISQVARFPHRTNCKLEISFFHCDWHRLQQFLHKTAIPALSLKIQKQNFIFRKYLVWLIRTMLADQITM